MARTWGFTRRNRLPLAVIDAIGGGVARLLSGRRSGIHQGSTEAAQRILVVEFWNIGDVVLATPFLAALRERFPGASITLLGQDHAVEILADSDLVDAVIAIDVPWTAARRRYDPRRYGGDLVRAILSLRKRSFDIAFESRMDPRAKLLLALSGARRRVAFDYGGCNWLVTDPVPVNGFDRHRVDDWAALLEPFGGCRALQLPRLVPGALERSWARAWLKSHGIERDARVIAVHPGASGASKRWPLARFAEVAAQVASWPDTRVVAIEDPAGYGWELARIRGVQAIRPTLRQLLALLAEVDVLVGNDSGPMHLAAAAGTATVGIFHPHAAREFAPLGPGHHVLAPAGGNAMRGRRPEAADLLGVQVKDVIAAVHEALSHSTRTRCAAGS